MDFKYWINESSINDLYQSAVGAFPETTKRQHAIDPIKITNLNWIPFLGVKTLYVRGLAQSEGKEYNPSIVFQGVKYSEEFESGLVKLSTNDGLFFLERLSLDTNAVRVHCNCPDFRWRFRYYNYLDHSLYGPKGKKYVALGIGPPANPQEMPGMCKHLMKMCSVLEQAKLFKV